MDLSLLLPLIGAIVLSCIIFFAMFNKMVKTQLVGQTQHLDDQRATLDQKEAEINKQLEDLKRQSQELIANAQKEAQSLKEAAQKEAQEKSDKIVHDANANADEIMKQADNARLALMADIENKINDRAVVKAVELLAAALPEKTRLQVHESWFDDLVSGDMAQFDRLKIPEGVSEVVLATAFALTAAQKQSLISKFMEKLSMQVSIKETVDPGLIAGVVVSIGNLYFDGSLKFKVQEGARGR